MLSSEVSSHSFVLMAFKFASVIKANRPELKTGEGREMEKLWTAFTCSTDSAVLSMEQIY